MNKAAQHFDMNQSAVSRAIQMLEKHLDFKLFYRQKKQLLLTQEGHKFLTELDKLIAALSVFDESISTIKQGIKELRFGVPTGLSLRFAPEIIQHYRQVQPDCSIRLDIRSSQALCEDVNAGNLDMALVARLTEITPAVHHFPIMQTPLVCVVNNNHPLASRTTLSINDIIKTQVIFPSKLEIAGVWVDKIDPDLFKQAKIIANVGSIVGLVEQGLGIAVLNLLTASDMSDLSKVSIIPLTPLMPLDIHLICRLDWLDNHDINQLLHSIEKSLTARKITLPSTLSPALLFHS